MSTFVMQAGPLVFPVLLFGVTALVASIVHFGTRGRRSRALAIGLAVATVLTGVFGSVTGLQRGLSALHRLEPDDRWLVALGLYEALHTTSLGLACAILVALFLTATAVRKRTVEVAGNPTVPAESRAT